MQKRISFFGWDHWKPLNVNRPSPRVAVLRRELLTIDWAGLREIRSQVSSPTRAQAHALDLFEQVLTATRAVAGAAARGDPRAYYRADIRMRSAIQATRAAFAREGAGHICDFAI